MTAESGRLAVDAVASVRATPDVQASLSPQGKALASVLAMSFESKLGTLNPAASVSAAVLSGAYLYATDVIQKSVAHVARTISETASMATGFSDAIPFIGAIINFVAQALGPGAAKGKGAASSDAVDRANFCRSDYHPVMASGPEPVPADLFAQKEYAPGEQYRSTTGVALIALTEKNKYIPGPTKETLRKLRVAIESMYSPPGSPPTTDGGAALFPLYLDIANAQFKKGRMPQKYTWDLMHKYVYWPISENVGPGEKSCFAWEKRGQQEAMALIHGWEKKINPSYTQFVDAAQALASAVQEATRITRSSSGSSRSSGSSSMISTGGIVAIGAIGAGVATLAIVNPAAALALLRFGESYALKAGKYIAGAVGSVVRG